MEPVGRYEILDTIAAGDFAKVYRARDRELGREVAIKQIHQQFLGNPRQLERYWHEAQLLASLQHPNIVTIYDIVRSRGWLILELMRGSLQQSVETGPIDLDYLRASLVCCLEALSFLHTNGVIHGDVKPSNMLIDAQGRVKLGDFGLAHRASSQQGSLLKGTTKYMAPEMVSDQFGPVGPASDLYSVGFSAYELMCGPQFDSLFPGLATFGRDRQIAWLMWHAAPDRKLPEIARVLEGVPEDLARVIERLTTKEQAGRYHSAKAALRDLRVGEATPGEGEPSADEDSEGSDRRKRLTRIAAVGAMVFSVVLCTAMLFWPAGHETPAVLPPEPVQGVIANVYPKDPSIEVEYGAGKEKKLKAFSLRLGATTVVINQTESLPRHLQKDDRVRVEYHVDASGRAIADVVRAARPKKEMGTIRAIDAAAKQFTLAAAPGGELVDIRVPDALAIVFNGKDTSAGKPVGFRELRTGDQVTVGHVPDDLQAEKEKRVATDLSVLREVTSEGIVRRVSKSELTIETAGGQSEPWPLAPRAAVWINKGNTLSQRALTPLDLQGGDKVKVTHDSRVVRVDAERIITLEGAAVQAVQSKMLEVRPKPDEKPISFITDAQTKITLANEPVDVTALRAGDVVDLTHSSALDSPNPLALSVTARRTADLTRWAILIGIQKYDDAKLPAEHAGRRRAAPPGHADQALRRAARSGPPARRRQPVAAEGRDLRPAGPGDAREQARGLFRRSRPAR
jgi:tRNA A-37 threonylcarbamoyl transferase component Bud32